MSNSSATLVKRSARGALTLLATLGMLAASIRTAEAQASSPEAKTWEFRLTSGGLVATGNQKNFLKDAKINAAQLSWLVRPSLAITGTLGWIQMWKRPEAFFSSRPGIGGRPEYATMLRLLNIASHGPRVRSKLQFCGLAGSMCFR